MSNYIAIRSGASALPEGHISRFVTDLISSSGVVNIADSDWQVSENNPQGMSVNIAIGSGIFYGSSMSYHGFSTAVNNISITANSSGNPRIDAIVAYVDKSATPDATASNVLKFDSVDGTPATSPVIPNDSIIQSAIGAGNPYIILASVYVSNGAISIVNSNITDLREDITFSVSKLKSKPNILSYTPSAGSTQAIDLSTLATGGDIYVTMPAGNITLNLTNGVAGQKFALIILQDSVGSRTTSFTQTIKWPDGVAPTNSGANKIDTYAFRVVNSSNFLGYTAGQNQ